MKEVSKIVSKKSNQTVQTRLTQGQVDTVGYFFARVRVIYGHQYMVNFPDEATENYAKREFARQVCDIPREIMDKGFQALHRVRQDKPDEWRFIDLDRIIGLVKTGGEEAFYRRLKKIEKEQQARIEQKIDPSSEAQVNGWAKVMEARKGLKG